MLSIVINPCITVIACPRTYPFALPLTLPGGQVCRGDEEEHPDQDEESVKIDLRTVYKSLDLDITLITPFYQWSDVLKRRKLAFSHSL